MVVCPIPYCVNCVGVYTVVNLTAPLESRFLCLFFSHSQPRLAFNTVTKPVSGQDSLSNMPIACNHNYPLYNSPIYVGHNSSVVRFCCACQQHDYVAGPYTYPLPRATCYFMHCREHISLLIPDVKRRESISHICRQPFCKPIFSPRFAASYSDFSNYPNKWNIG